jgi:hypothetical protein
MSVNTNTTAASKHIRYGLLRTSSTALIIIIIIIITTTTTTTTIIIIIIIIMPRLRVSYVLIV